MDTYSQQKLKIAATEPEHVVRKAEFDSVVASLDERIVVIEKAIDERPPVDGPAVLRPSFPLENMEATDSVDSPQTKSTGETFSFSDATEGISPVRIDAEFSTESTTASDQVESPQTIPLGESAAASDEADCIMPDIHVKSMSELSCMSDTATSPQFFGERIMENTKMQGEIEVVIEDKQGVVKSRQKVQNAITEGFLRYSLYDMMNGGTLSSVLRSNIRGGYNLLSRTVPSALGIYAMDRPIDIRSDTFLPPYVTGDLNTLDPGVTFYNIGGYPVEDSQVMLPMDLRCYFDHNRNEMTVEYVKNTGSGVVKSVCVGRSHQLKPQMYSVIQNESTVPTQWTATTTNYLVEHHATNGTSLWKTVSAYSHYRFNLKNRTADPFTTPPVGTNIAATNSVGGLVVGEHIFKAVKQTATASNYTIRLHYVANFKTLTTAAYKDIVLTAREGLGVLTDTMPVMVYRTDTNKLELLVTMSLGEAGYNIHKVTVSGLETPGSMTTEVVDMGFLPYAVSNFGTTAALYLTGYHDGANYYLPYTSTVDVNGKIDLIAENAFQNGVVISNDFKTISRVFNMRSQASTPNLIVRADTGLLQCQANLANIPYIFMSQVVSGANLPEPSVKGLDDVLRVIYRYKLS